MVSFALIVVSEVEVCPDETMKPVVLDLGLDEMHCFSCLKFKGRGTRLVKIIHKIGRLRKINTSYRIPAEVECL